MPSTAAEVARTLAAGRLVGRLSVPGLPDDIPVAHATTPGGILFAARRDSRAWLSLMLSADDRPAALSVKDRPPFPDSPHLGTVHIGGWITPVPEAQTRAAGLRFADINPLDDLLDVGNGVDMFRLEPGEIHLEAPGGPRHLEPEEFAAAVPDPLHPDEHDLLRDLRDHHADEIAALVPGSPRQVRPVRLDRYGLTLALPTLARLEFTRPANCACCVARALRLNHATAH